MHPAPILVLVAPQDIVNIGSAVRIARNFGLAQLRLVTPEVFDPWRIEGIAHNTGEFIEQITIHESLTDAVADCTWTLALTARERAAKRTVYRPGAGAAELIARAELGPVAYVVGREDKGLTNEELDQCSALVTIPTNPEYKSLNLAQAVAIMGYESCSRAGGSCGHSSRRARRARRHRWTCWSGCSPTGAAPSSGSSSSRAGTPRM